MKYLKRFNESLDETVIIDFISDIFLELKDNNNNIDIEIIPRYKYSSSNMYTIPDKTKIVGFDIRISSQKYPFKLSDIYDNVLVCMDYMRSNNMFLKSFDSLDISNNNSVVDINYFYDYMMGVEKDVSSKYFSIRFNLKVI